MMSNSEGGRQLPVHANVQRVELCWVLSALTATQFGRGRPALYAGNGGINHRDDSAA